MAAMSLILGGLILLVLVGVGIFLLVRYFQTRKIGFLIAGLISALVLPGLLLCLLVVLWIPSQMVVYAPPPPGFLP